MNRRIKNIFIDMEVVVLMYNEHPYFLLANLGQEVHIIYNKIYFYSPYILQVKFFSS